MRRIQIMSIKVVPIADEEEVIELSHLRKNIEFGETHLVFKDSQLYLFVGICKQNTALEDIRFLGGTVRKKVQENLCGEVKFDFPKLMDNLNLFSEEMLVSAFMEGWYLAGYQFLPYKQKERDEAPIIQFEKKAYETYASQAATRADAVNIARDLCNEPANILTPATYASRITDIFKETIVDVEIIETEALEEKGFTAIATVGKGSSNPPKLAVLTLENKGSKHVALVGKGVTFDSGGTNVKVGGDIAEMKMDMGGSAAVVGAMKLLADLDLPVHVTAIIPLVTNVAGGNAFLPSDVIKYSNGLTVEVGNTDAEGRLVLADGILHAQHLGAETIVDIATLTGTIGQALGLKVAGIFSNQEEKLWSYKELGDRTGDYVWPMPVIKDYHTYLKSDTADFNNRSSSKFGGAITAALFLEKFVVENRKWIHIDMANTVSPWKVEGYYVPGASGFGVRLLTEIVCQEME